MLNSNDLFDDGAHCILLTRDKNDDITQVQNVTIQYLNSDILNPTVALKLDNGEYIKSNITHDKKQYELTTLIKNNLLKTISDFAAEYVLCPVCQKRYIDKDYSCCKHCVDTKRQNRIKKIQSFFLEHVTLDKKPYTLDDEQLDALTSKNNTLITARAGSGKTRVLTAKIIDLLYNHNIPLDNIRAFCFNSAAAKEIRDRLINECAVDNVPLNKKYNIKTSNELKKQISTFHYFAIKVLDISPSKILRDKDNLIKIIIRDMKKSNKEFNTLLYDYFFNSTATIDHNYFNTREEYYYYVKHSRYRTLKGDQVKSYNEKIIADFLFEHDINYQYEKSFSLRSIDSTVIDNVLTETEHKQFINVPHDFTIPDFYLPDYKIIWEHWGVIGNESEADIDRFCKLVGNYDDYLRNRAWKKNFWNNLKDKFYYKNYNDRINILSVKKLIETNSAQLYNHSQYEIEDFLTNFLSDNGIYCRKLSDDEIIQRTWNNAKDSFTELMTNFINKYQQAFYDNPDEFTNLIKKVSSKEESVFLKLGMMVYSKYLEVLKNDNNEFQYREYDDKQLDYNQCLAFAIRKISNGGYTDTLKNIKYILIDEYQDFNKLFYDLINAMININPDIKVLAVGDSWQAINRFMGADIKYYENFSNYYSDTKKYDINTNYRCSSNIIDYVNKFVKRAKLSLSKKLNAFRTEKGECIIHSIHNYDTSYCIDIRDYMHFEYSLYTSYKFNIDSFNKYINIFLTIIKNSKNKEIVFLNRKNKFMGVEITMVEKKLRQLAKINELPDNFSFITVHKAKGLQADIVVLFDIDEGSFPSLHAENNLFHIFGDNLTEIIKDEARLYYVALTRAIDKLYILYDNPSEFIFQP